MNQPPAPPVRSPSPDESFLASLRRRIEWHFNPDHIMQNDVLQAILTCYQGCYPLQLVLANPFFQDYIAHCTEMGLPVVPTFLRAIEHSRLISVTDDQLFIYLVVVPQLQQPCPTKYFEAAALGPMMQQQPTVYGPSCESTRDNVQELASINGNPQMIQPAQNCYNQPAHSSGSPTSVFEAYHDAQQQPIVTMMIGNNATGTTPDYPHPPTSMNQQGQPHKGPSAFYVIPRPTRQLQGPGLPLNTAMMPPVANNDPGPVILQSPKDTSFASSSVIGESKEKVVEQQSNKEPPTKPSRKKRYWGNKKKHNNRIPKASGVEEQVAQLTVQDKDSS